MRGQHRKRAQEKITNDSALATKQGHLAKVSEAVEIINHRAPHAAACHSVIPASGIQRSSRPTKSVEPFINCKFLKKCAT
jgi:hypothetical protein